jgi:phosphoribosyl-AMP cyclohydrolase / phosphoribosyl-ATP pyrophosphohydrolase
MAEENKLTGINPDFAKYADGLMPVIVQDATTHKVLMLGFMNEEALHTTQTSQKICFFSRSKQRLWTKGETSGHFLQVQSIHIDCDADTLLIKAYPKGPVCHTGADTCFGETNDENNVPLFLQYLEQLIQTRKQMPATNSYVATMFNKGINKIAQKVGEEAVELVIEAKDNNSQLFLNEAADLLFHYLLLLNAKDFNLQQVIGVLKERHTQK